MPAEDNSLVLLSLWTKCFQSHRQPMAELECKISPFQTRLSSETILQFGSTDKYFSVFIFLFCVALCGLNMTFTNVLPPARQVIASLFHTNGDRDSSPG